MVRVGKKRTPSERLQELQEQLKLLPVEIRSAVEMLVAWEEGLMSDLHSDKTVARRDRIGLSVSGAIGLFLLLGIAIAIPDPSDFQERVFIIVLGIAGAAAGAFLPGAINVEGGYRPTVWVRAGGAIGFAVFLILVYRFLL